MMTRGLLLEGLLYGTENSMDDSLEEYGIRLKGRKIFIILYQMVFDISGQIDFNIVEIPIYKQLLQNKMDEILLGNNYMCDLNIDSGAFLCIVEEKQLGELSKEFLREKMEDFTVSFREDFGIRLRLAAGSICNDSSQISKIYDQIYEILQYGPAAEKDVLFYKDYANEREYYYFPLPLEERLVNAVRTGNEESLHDQLHEVYQVNVLEREISPEMMHFLVNDLQCTVFRALNSLNDRPGIREEEIFAELDQLSRETDILVRFNKINGIFKQICARMKEQNETSTNEQEEQIREYIEKNYSSNDLSLTKIADDFGYSSTYFSRLFKELFGENFASYLEKVRIEQVCILLESGDTMETIAGKTGYNSVYVMRTAFKRVKGVTPNDYRRMRQEAQAERKETAEKDEPSEK